MKRQRLDHEVVDPVFSHSVLYSNLRIDFVANRAKTFEGKGV